MIRPAEEIQRQMRSVRDQLHQNVDDVAESTRELADWQTYVKQYPWLCLGAAFAAGFIAVPKKINMISPDADTLLELANRHKLVVEPKPKASKGAGIGGNLLKLVGTIAVRSALGYAGHFIGKQQAGEAVGD